MIGLANRVRLTTERSPVPLDPFSVTMNGLDQLQPLGKRFSLCNLFMLRISVNTCTTKDTRISLHAHDGKERADVRSHASIPQSVTRRSAPISAAAARRIPAKS